MKYKNHTLPINQIVINHKGTVLPMCNNCKTRDCEHLVEEKRISLMGVNYDWKVIIKAGTVVIVVACEGYSK
jgi:hypothetical protein